MDKFSKTGMSKKEINGQEQEVLFEMSFKEAGVSDRMGLVSAVIAGIFSDKEKDEILESLDKNEMHLGTLTVSASANGYQGTSVLVGALVTDLESAVELSEMYKMEEEALQILKEEMGQ